MSNEFSGHIYIFHAFDVGDDINTEAIVQDQILTRVPVQPSKYFKNYHRPIGVELPHPHTTSHCESVKLHPFGVISLTYKIPFKTSLEKLREEVIDLDDVYREQSVADASVIYRYIESYVKKPTFFHITTYYVLIQINTQEGLSGKQLAETHGGTIVPILRFEDEVLSEYKKNEVLARAFGYYRGDLIIIDTAAAFMYDDEYEETLEFFEFVNIQQLELQYFDRVLDKQLTQAYVRGYSRPVLREYVPILGHARSSTGLDNLGILKVEISVITERIENSIKIVGEPYFSELYAALTRALDLENWKESIAKKLEIIHDLNSVYESQAQAARDDVYNILIVILIFIEVVIAVIGFVGRFH